MYIGVYMCIYIHMFFYFKDVGGYNNFQGSIVSRILLNKIVVFSQYLTYFYIRKNLWKLNSHFYKKENILKNL